MDSKISLCQSRTTNLAVVEMNLGKNKFSFPDQSRVKLLIVELDVLNVTFNLDYDHL